MASSKTVLIIEDDNETRRMVSEALGSNGYRVIEAEAAKVGLHLFNTRKPDLVILDVKLPDMDGFEICRRVRSHGELGDRPVIMLTGEGDVGSKVTGIEAGADQYLVKPVFARELLAWVEALLRRLAYDKEPENVLKAGELSIELDSRLIRLGDSVISTLTPKEFDLLYYLVKNRPKVLSRADILAKLWQTITVDNVVDVHIGHLRRKLPPAVSDRIQNVPGKGFRYFAD